jgi:glycosyltransferase involved in cell wall biosynthesis
VNETTVIRVLELRSVRGTGGGPEKTILFGAARHDRQRFAITVCYLRDARDAAFGIAQRARGLDLDYVELRERHSLDRRIWPALVSLVRERRIDIVHGHDYKTNLLALLLARRTGAAPMATAHGWTGHSARERWLYYPAEKRLLRWMPGVIAVSSDVRDVLTRAGVHPDRVTVLLNGIDPQAFARDPERRAAVRRDLGLRDHHVLIGGVGRLEPQKRFDLLIRAFARIKAEHPTARLAIAGDGSLRRALEADARAAGVAAETMFLGHRLDIAALHDAFDLFVQSSDYEGTPNAVLEAMAMETPIVASDAGGTAELARPDEHAIVVPCGDADALARGMLAALDNPVRARERAAAARRRIEGDLSFGERTRRLEEIYDRMTATGRRTANGDAPQAARVTRA